MHKLNLYDVARCAGFNISQNAFFRGVSVDSRLHQPENLFFALPGMKTDGHLFLKEIASKGAAGAVVKNDYQGPDYGLTLLHVEDPLESLQNLGKEILRRSQSRVVAVTGSVGKTTTKDFIKTLLLEKFQVAASPGNSNSQIGLPLAILNHTTGHEDIIVLEMGMTHQGNIRKLIHMAPPECVVITSVAFVHACNFESLEDIARAKAEILEHAHTQVAIINCEMDHYDAISKIGTCQKVSFAYNNPLTDYTLSPQQSDNYTVKFHEQIFHLGQFPIPGQHNQTNFLAAIACVRYFGMDFEEIAAGMKKLVLPPLRWQTTEKEGIHFINDAYNSSPIAVKAALMNIPTPKPGGCRVAVLADMLELGKFSEKSHREVGDYALNYVDRMFCYGTESLYILDSWQKANRPVQWFSQREELLHALKKDLKAGDVVLVKGSRGTQLSKLLDEWENLPK